MNIKLLFLATIHIVRAPFLLLTVVVVALGGAIAFHNSHTIDVSLFGLIFLGALAAHTAANALNEYIDFKSGLDEKTNRTPFSGGSGFLPRHPQLAPYAKWLGILALMVTVGVGLYLIMLRGWGILPFGVVGILLIVAYTPWISKQPHLCFMAPGVGFGPLMMLGTYYVLTGGISSAAIAVSVIVLLLVNNLLLLNQFPDVEADREVGRRHFPIVIGRYPSAWIYTSTSAIAFSLVGLFWIAGIFPTQVLWVAIILPLAALITGKVLRYADELPKLAKVLGLNVVLVLGTSALLVLGFVTGGVPTEL